VTDAEARASANAPPSPQDVPHESPEGLRDLASGNPNPGFFPSYRDALAKLKDTHVLYGEPAEDPELLELASKQFEDDGIDAKHLAVLGGALDGIERVLPAHLRPGDKVAVEDPGHAGILDLIAALGLVPEPMPLDDFGPLPDAADKRCAAAPGA
jgi:DNA-binding transcriptional MocR family regulator